MLHISFNGFYYGMKIRIAVSSLIYRKVGTISCDNIWCHSFFSLHEKSLFSYFQSQILRLSQKSVSSTAPGKLVNLLSNDLQQFDNVTSIHALWVSPLTSTIAAYILWEEIGLAAFVGIGIVAIFVPIQSNLLSKYITFYSKSQTNRIEFNWIFLRRLFGKIISIESIQNRIENRRSGSFHGRNHMWGIGT